MSFISVSYTITYSHSNREHMPFVVQGQLVPLGSRGLHTPWSVVTSLRHHSVLMSNGCGRPVGDTTKKSSRSDNDTRFQVSTLQSPVFSSDCDRLLAAAERGAPTGSYITTTGCRHFWFTYWSCALRHQASCVVTFHPNLDVI